MNPSIKNIKLKRAINILIIVFLGLTIFLTIIHLEKVEYYIDKKTNETQSKISNKDFEVSLYMRLDSIDKLRLYLNFNYIKTDFYISKLNVSLENSNLIEIKPYSGMKNWDNPVYLNFSNIPDSIKFLSPKSNPYYAFDHFFSGQSKADKFDIKVNIGIIKDNKMEELIKEISIIKTRKIEIRPWDMHSDFTFLFLYLFSFISVILIIIRLLIFGISKIW